MYLTNAEHEHFTTQTGKKSKTALKKFMGPGSRGTEGREKQIPIKIKED